MSKPPTHDNAIPDANQWSVLMGRIAQERDGQAFSRLFEHFGPLVKDYAMKSGADAPRAERCVQDVMRAAWHEADQFDPTRVSVATWVFTIARDRRITLSRQETRPQPARPTNERKISPPLDTADKLERDHRRLTDAISALPDEQKDVFAQAVLMGCSLRQIAINADLPPETIKSRTGLALKNLHHTMGWPLQPQPRESTP